MKQTFRYLIILISVFLTFCDKSDDPSLELKEFGYLSLKVALQIEALPASGRVEAVSPDNFLVTIHDASDGSEVMRWETYAEVPAEVQLPTGSYFVRTTNLEFPEDAAFEQPWYFGESDVFTIDKEEFKTIDVECTLANCKISFSYSQNVQDNFTNWDAKATIDDGAGTGAFLEWIQNDPAEGYFLTDNPIDIEVYLEYVKLTNPDEKITRTFNATIEAPVPATHYLINVDASLEDGKIVINITVNDEFETVEITLGDEVPDPNENWVQGEPWIDERDGVSYSTEKIGDHVWFTENLRAVEYNDGTQISLVSNQQNWAILDTPGYSWYDNDEETNAIYGPLYNFYAIEAGNLCPTSWHVATEMEWNFMISNLEGASNAGGKLKEIGLSHWSSPNTGATDEYNFTGLPGGSRGDNGVFYNINLWGNWWTSDQSLTSSLGYSKHIGYNTTEIFDGNYPKKVGFSVRCVKD